MYPMLNQTQTAGMLTSAEEIVGGKRRKNFRATAAGRKLLKESRTKLRELASEVLDDKDDKAEEIECQSYLRRTPPPWSSLFG